MRPVDTVTLELLAAWKAEDAMTDPEKLREADEEIVAFKKHIFGALAYYSANRQELDRYPSAGRTEFEALRQQWRRDHPDLYERLVEARHRTSVPGA